MPVGGIRFSFKRLEPNRDHALEAIELAARRKRRDLETNRLLMHALTRLVEIVGEAADQVPTDIQKTHGTIPWRDAIGMRHRLIHGYDEVDLDILWATVKEDLPALAKQLDIALSD